MTIWHVPGPAGELWARPPDGGGPPPRTVRAGITDVTAALAGAPRQLVTLWQLAAAAAGPVWGWQVQRAGPAAAPDTWTLLVTRPGSEQRYTWIRKGGRMRLAVQTETSTRAGPARLTTASATREA